jgi:dTDP-4-dehydrorhamnose 3,5-epimerase
MVFTETPIKGAYVIDLEPHTDNRGFFARVFCARELAINGLTMQIVQTNLSLNRKKGTLRGMHYSVPPAAEAKLVRCFKGGIYDVIVDIRRDSPTFLTKFAIELTAANRKALYIPEMVAHGFQTLTDDVEVYYQMSQFYVPEVQRGLRYDDPVLNIDWPLPVSEISEKDLQLPFWNDQMKKAC